MLALLDLYLKAPVCYYESNDSFKLSDVKYFLVISLSLSVAVLSCMMSMWSIRFSAFYLEMIFYFIKSIRLSGQWSAAWWLGPRSPTHHQSLINTEFQGFVAGAAARAGGAPCSC